MKLSRQQVFYQRTYTINVTRQSAGNAAQREDLRRGDIELKWAGFNIHVRACYIIVFYFIRAKTLIAPVIAHVS